VVLSLAKVFSFWCSAGAFALSTLRAWYDVIVVAAGSAWMERHQSIRRIDTHCRFEDVCLLE
jgi:hypothetical protein